MDCLLPVIASFCLADPSTLTLRADAHYQVSHKNFMRSGGAPYNGSIGRVELHLQSSEWRGLRLTYFAGHLSFIDTTKDRGYEYVGGGVVWRPFR